MRTPRILSISPCPIAQMVARGFQRTRDQGNEKGGDGMVTYKIDNKKKENKEIETKQGG